ncbi:DUF4913 domain-containing protein [Pseudonocardia sp. ICBG1142]|uniref:DUF4913 domain-containing protein n=1 Tax=Pseudonocardia sp. ICBG1142 TaxID=2846760 RepID=UPI001CF6A5B2|nr:DUF4913 domain-containing protein [Pseudonocardia sp. ICBG1142]
MTSDHDTSNTESNTEDSRAAHVVLLEALRDDHTLLDHRVADLADELDTLAGTFDRLEKTLRAASVDHDTPTPDAPEHRTDTSPTDVPDTDSTKDDSTKDTAGDKDSSDDRDRDDGPDMQVLLSWVRHTIAERCERKLPQGQGRIRWCRSWWHHREAHARFAALYRAWVEATDPETGTGTALVTYYEHLDHTLEVLMSDHGPFSACPGGRHRPPDRGDPTVGYLGQDRHPDEPEPSEEKEP